MGNLAPHRIICDLIILRIFLSAYNSVITHVEFHINIFYIIIEHFFPVMEVFRFAPKKGG